MSDDQMLREHRNTFDSFVKLVSYSVVFIVAVLVLLAIFVV